MITYIIRRLFLMVIVILLVSLLVFFAMRLLPGDPMLMIISQSDELRVTQDQLAEIREQYGLNDTLIIQYFHWIGGVVHGDLGQSIMQRIPVANEIVRRIPITLHIGLTAYFLGFILGIPAGILCAVKRGRPIDTIVTALANIGITVPAFWMGLILIYLFGLKLQWLPIMGYTSPFTDFGTSIQQLVMPVFCLMMFPLASTARQTRSSMLEVMRQDYIRTAWSKGLTERIIIFRHALKNSLIPVITFSGIGLSMLIGGAVIVETVFNIPGMGRLAVTSIQNQDYPYVQGIVLIIATVVMLVNFLVDLTYGWLDPRIRYN